jgi:hypothetical protein
MVHFLIIYEPKLQAVRCFFGGEMTENIPDGEIAGGEIRISS